MKIFTNQQVYEISLLNDRYKRLYSEHETLVKEHNELVTNYVKVMKNKKETVRIKNDPRYEDFVGIMFDALMHYDNHSMNAEEVMKTLKNTFESLMPKEMKAARLLGKIR